MDGFGQHLFDQAPRCFDHFAIIMLDKSDIWWQSSLRVFLPYGYQLDVLHLLQEIFYLVVIIGSVGLNNRSSW